METKAKLEEVLEILAAMLGKSRPSGNLRRAHKLVQSAIGDFFQNQSDVAVIPDDEMVDLGAEPPAINLN